VEPMRKILITFVAFTAVAHAQYTPHAVQGSVLDHVALPGELATTSGNLSAYETGNFVAESYAEQRAMILSVWNDTFTVTPYVGADFLLDTAGYNWNNKVSPSFGFKFNKKVHVGVLTAGIGYMYENRFRNASGFKPTGGRTDFLTDWFGWNDVTDRDNRFPGSTWAIVGHYSPVESGNLMERGHVQQGFVVKRFGATALVPYAEATLAHDSKRFDWENIAVLGTGLKVGVPTGHEIYSEIGVGYLHETRLISNRTATGMKVFVDISYSWSLFGRKLP
jgi:hypothetical protein